MIQCRKCKNIPGAPVEYIGQTKWTLRDRFGEHRTEEDHRCCTKTFQPKGTQTHRRGARTTRTHQF